MRIYFEPFVAVIWFVLLVAMAVILLATAIVFTVLRVMKSNFVLGKIELSSLRLAR